MNKLRIGLFYGGPSKEHEVSLNTAAQIAENLDNNKYVVQKILIDKQGNWPEEFSKQTIKDKIDFAFIAMHGAYGEDGVIQAIFQDLIIPYSGSRVMASSLAMDKYRSGLIATQIGLKIPKTWLIGLSEIDELNLPDQLILKPNDSGSSDGLELILKSEVNKQWLQFHHGFLLQEYLKGREITVPILGTKALPIIEIISANQMYDYSAKYTSGQSQHIVPALLDKEFTQSIQNQALAIHDNLGCHALSRSDFIIKDDEVYYLETNTIPGMTKTSLLPESALASGIEFPKLLDLIIEYSLPL